MSTATETAADTWVLVRCPWCGAPQFDMKRGSEIRGARCWQRKCRGELVIRTDVLS